MAGGEGSRLRPITCACPKPMVPVLDKPVMEYALELLVRHGVREACVTLMYLPERIMDHFADGSEYGLTLTYRMEKTPLGTAGGVRAARDFLDGTTVILSGDGLTDCDLTRALAFHREKGALATMVLKKVKSPLEYGVVCTDGDGRVTRFVEKPGWGEVCSDAVNTGIYLIEPGVLDFVPDQKPFDFGRELFPKLVEAGQAVYGFHMDGYWCDIGDPASYLRSHVDLLDGKMKTDRVVPGKQPGSFVDKSAVLESPCFIAKGARVEAGARIGPYTVLGLGAVVGENASVKRSVLWRGARAGARSQLRGCVVLPGAKVGEAASAFEESVLGEGARLGEGAVLMPGVRVWPGKAIEDGERVDGNRVWGEGARRRLENGAFAAASPAQVAKDAQAFVSALKLRTVIVGRDESAVGLACQKASVSGLMAQGVQVIDIGSATLPVTRWALWDSGAGGALHVGRDGIVPLNATGGRLTMRECRAVSGMLSSEEYAAPFSGVTRPPVVMSQTQIGYIGRLLERTGACFDPGRAPSVAVHSPYEQMLSLCEETLRRAGCAVRAEWEEELMELGPGEIGVWIGPGGQSVRFADEQGLLTEAEQTLLLCYAALETGADRLILPRGATRAAQALCQGYEANLTWTPSDEAEWQKALLTENRTLFELFFDGLYATLTLLTVLHRNQLTLREALSELPRVARRTHTVPMELRDKGRLLRALSEALPDADATDGITIERGNGWAWINPAGEKRACVVVGESADMETAKELCDFCLDEIERAMKKDG